MPSKRPKEPAVVLREALLNGVGHVSDAGWQGSNIETDKSQAGLPAREYLAKHTDPILKKALVVAMAGGEREGASGADFARRVGDAIAV